MNRFLALCLVVAVSVSEGYAASLRQKRQVIPREFQNINIENYLKNERAVRFQLKCIIDDGPCDRIGKYLKVTIPELLVNQCANCDMAQRERAGKLVSHIQQNYPEEWERAVKKFQGGQLVKADDAARLESILGVKLDPKLVAEASSTAAPAPSSSSPVPEAKSAELPSSSPVPVEASSTTAATASSSEAPATSSAAPASSSTSSVAPETSSVAAAVSEASTTMAAAAAPSSTTAAAVSSSTSEASSTAAAVASSSAAPAA